MSRIQKATGVMLRVCAIMSGPVSAVAVAAACYWWHQSYSAPLTALVCVTTSILAGALAFLLFMLAIIWVDDYAKSVNPTMRHLRQWLSDAYHS